MIIITNRSWLYPIWDSFEEVGMDAQCRKSGRKTCLLIGEVEPKSSKSSKLLSWYNRLYNRRYRQTRTKSKISQKRRKRKEDKIKFWKFILFERIYTLCAVKHIVTIYYILLTWDQLITKKNVARRWVL